MLDQRPRALIEESSMPALAAEVAAPVRKLWPEYKDATMPASVRTSRTRAINRGFVNGEPSLKQKNGPGANGNE